MSFSTSNSDLNSPPSAEPSKSPSSSPSPIDLSDRSTAQSADPLGGNPVLPPSVWLTSTERDLLASAGLLSFRAFAKHVYGISRHPRGRWWSESVHGPICDWFQDQVEEWLDARRRSALRLAPARRRFIAILVPRACGKSVLITRAGMMWLHLQDPNLSTYLGAATTDLAVEFLTTIKQVLEGKDGNSYWRWLYGDWTIGAGRWKVDELTHGARTMGRGEPSFAIWSANSGITGRHPDVLCMDDLVTTEALNKDSDWLNHAYAHLTSMVPVVESDGLIIMVGTRYADNDPFGRSFSTEGIATIAGHTNDPDYRTKPNGLWHVYFLSGRDPSGAPSVPTCWSDEAMAGVAKRDIVYYAYQILNRPKAPELIALTEEKFDAQIIASDKLPLDLLITIHYDKAFNFAEKIRTDSDTALAFCGHSRAVPGMVYVLELEVSSSWTPPDLAKNISRLFRKWHSKGYTIVAMTDEMEPGGNAGVIQSYLYNHFVDEGLAIYWPDYHTFNRLKGAAKDTRISQAIDFVVAGLVKFSASCTSLPILKYQLCNHPFSGKKDAADAFADAFHKDIYQTKIPRLLTAQNDNPKDFMGAYEDRSKGQNWWNQRDTLMEFDRQPIGALRRGASPHP